MSNSTKETHTSGPEDIKPSATSARPGNAQRDKLNNGTARVPSDNDQYGTINCPEGGAYSDHDARDNSPQI